MRMFWVYGSSSCQWCNEAVRLLKAHGHTVVYMDVGTNRFLRDPSWKTIPQIFDVGHHVGGYEELVKYLEV